MKNSKINICTLVALIFLISCNKEETEKTPNTAVKSTIAGVAYADLDMTEPGYEYAPQGTRIFVAYSIQQVIDDPVPNTTYPIKFFETVVGPDGKYSITFDVGNNPLMIAVYADQFLYDKIIAPSLTETTTYVMPMLNILIMPGQSRMHNIYYI